MALQKLSCRLLSQYILVMSSDYLVSYYHLFKNMVQKAMGIDHDGKLSLEEEVVSPKSSAQNLS